MLNNGGEIMSYSINGTTITLTRGDSLEAHIAISKADGTPYTPNDNDRIRFAMKEYYTDPAPILIKEIPVSTMTLILEPSDTSKLSFGEYVYDVQLTKANGKTDTFISKAKIIISEEVD